MAKTHGKDAKFSLDNSAGTLTDLSTYSDSVDWGDDANLEDVTAFGDGGEKTVPGLAGATIAVGGPWDPTLDAHFAGIIRLAGTQTFEIGPEGSTTGKRRFTGECRVSNYATRTPVAGRVEWSVDLHVEGAPTYNTYA